MKTKAIRNLHPDSICSRAAGMIVAIGLMTATTVSVWAQGQIASGTIDSSGTGPYSYSLTFTDAGGASSPIGSVWYAWVPGAFYLPGAPTSVSAPAGWTATISLNSVQYVATSPANYIQPGQSLSGFGYQATFSPAQLAAAANSGVSVAYSGGLFSDPGNTFTVQSVPEPSGSALMLCAAVSALFAIVRAKRIVPELSGARGSRMTQPE